MDGRSERLGALRAAAREGRNPTASDEVLACLVETARRLEAKTYLEIGAGEGLTLVALCLEGVRSLVGIERDPVRAATAKRNFSDFGCAERIALLEGDAGEILPTLEGPFDLIFLDGPKVQYRRYFKDCKRLLRDGGVLITDDVLLFGWGEGAPVPKKRHMLAQHLEEYLTLLRGDSELTTEILHIGEGLAVSTKRKTE